MNLGEKFDRIVMRAEELRDLLGSGLNGDAFVAASRELSELAPVEERINELRAAERARNEAEALLADPELRELAET
jgi:peptide chain release factor 1